MVLASTEKQVNLGHLHMRLIQWHLQNWRVPEKIILIQRWLQEKICFKANRYTPLSHALQSLQTHQKKGGALTENTLQGDPGPFQKSSRS